MYVVFLPERIRNVNTIISKRVEGRVRWDNPALRSPDVSKLAAGAPITVGINDFWPMKCYYCYRIWNYMMDVSRSIVGMKRKSVVYE